MIKEEGNLRLSYEQFLGLVGSLAFLSDILERKPKIRMTYPGKDPERTVSDLLELIISQYELFKKPNSTGC